MCLSTHQHSTFMLKATCCHKAWLCKRCRDMNSLLRLVMDDTSLELVNHNQHQTAGQTFVSSGSMQWVFWLRSDHIQLLSTNPNGRQPVVNCDASNLNHACRVVRSLEWSSPVVKSVQCFFTTIPHLSSKTPKIWSVFHPPQYKPPITFSETPLYRHQQSLHPT